MTAINIHYLMQYISRRLHTIVRKFSSQRELLEAVCERVDLTDYLDCLQDNRGMSDNLENASNTYNFSTDTPGISSGLHEFLDNILNYANSDFPVIATGSHSVSYGIVVCNEEIFVIGPVALTAGAVCRHRLPRLPYTAPWLLTLHHCSTRDILIEALLLHNLFLTNVQTLDAASAFNCLDRQITYEIQKDYTDIVFSNHEYASHHNPYDQEVRETSSIRNGDLEHLKKSWEEDYTGEIGTLAKHPLRHSQNLAIVLVTLASRAAMEGGVTPEIAFSLSDSYINKIEEVHNPETAYQLGREAEYQYTVLVKEVKENRARRSARWSKALPDSSENETAGENFPDPAPDSRISRCKDYIFAHLHDKITTADIAKELYINANYLSGLFKKEEGMTISEYILQEKIKLVKNMLVYSRYSYIEIASYLGFCSQSHLGAKFKKVTGMTLHQYREKYGVREFNTR